MKIEKTNIANFGAGNIYLKRVPSDNIPSLKAIKKIAEDKGIDIFISKNKEPEYLSNKNIYQVMASKETPAKTRLFTQTGSDIENGVSSAQVNKEATKEELSVRIYNTAMNAIEILEKKLTQK